MKSVVLHRQAFEDLLECSRKDRKTLSRIFELINSIAKNPFDGIGKPEPLKYEFRGYWSRRINQEDRIVYKVTDDEIIILSCKEHYL